MDFSKLHFKDHLLFNNNIEYEIGLYYTIKEGGDTDTNACIVGGMLDVIMD